VLFPGGRLPLRIFEQRYLEMAKSCMKNQSPFGVCLIREGAEVGTPATPAGVGTSAHITAWDMPQLGLLQITARGGQRFRILERRVERDGLARAAVEFLPQDTDAPVSSTHSTSMKLLERVIEQHPALFERPHRLDSCSWVSARLAELLPLPLEHKQAMLELADGRTRLERLGALIRSDQGPSPAKAS
jgi:Lon protease-like protein